MSHVPKAGTDRHASPQTNRGPRKERLVYDNAKNTSTAKPKVVRKAAKYDDAKFVSARQ